MKFSALLLLCLIVLLLGMVSRPSYHRTDWMRLYEQDAEDQIIAIADAAAYIDASACGSHALGVNQLAPTNKPRLILHVGPSKSATTSLQTDLTSVQAELETDGYLYAGRYYNPYTNNATGQYTLKRSESSLLTSAHNMLLRCKLEPRVECCRNFSAELRRFPHSGKQRNIILSEEPFGNFWQNAEDWEAIRDAIGDDWDVTVVVGYRRFYAWLPSARFQHERTDRNVARKGPWPAKGGLKIDPFFPEWWLNWRRFFSYTGSILDALNGTFPVRIINLHNEEHRSPLTILLCDILNGEAETACQRSLERDQDPTVLNSRETLPSLYYDAIAVAAAEKGLVNMTAWTRPFVRAAIQSHHEDMLKLTPQDLVLDCPDISQLEALLGMSLQMEETYMPEFSQCPHHRVEHMDGFEAYVAQGVYCWVDTDVVLGQEAWKVFLSRYGKHQIE